VAVRNVKIGKNERNGSDLAQQSLELLVVVESFVDINRMQLKMLKGTVK